MNIVSILKQKQEDLAKVPAFLNSLVSKFESQGQKIRDILFGENSVTGKCSAEIDGVINSFDISELRTKISDETTDIADQVVECVKGGTQVVQVKLTDLVANLTDKYRETVAQATMYKELAANSLSDIVDVSNITSRIQAKLGDFKLPNVVQSFMDGLPHNATLSQWCATVSEHAKLPNSSTWDFEEYGATSGNIMVSAITDIANTVANLLAKLWQGLKKLAQGLGALVVAIKDVLGYLAKRLFTNLVVDYEYNGKGQWPSGDIPTASITYINVSQFLENFRQMCEIGSNGHTYLDNWWQLRNNNRNADCYSGLVPTKFIPNAYIGSVVNPSEKALDWFNQLTTLLTTYKNLTIFYNYWMIQAIILDDGSVKLGFFPSSYYPLFKNDPATADEDQGVSYDTADSFDVSTSTAQESGNRLFFYNVLGKPSAWTNMCRNLPVCYKKDSDSSSFDTGWPSDFTSEDIRHNLATLTAENFYSLFYTINAAATDDQFRVSNLVPILKSNSFELDDTDKTLKGWLQNHSEDDYADKFKLWCLSWFAYQAARSIADDAYIQYGGYMTNYYTYYYWRPEGTFYPHQVVTTVSTPTDTYWTPYYSDCTTTFLIHVQTNEERVTEWKVLITSIIVAVIAVVVAVKIAKFKKKAALKAQTADVAYFNAADAYNSNPTKSNWKALKKARRKNNFWSTINEKLSGGASTAASVKNMFSGVAESDITDSLIYNSITGTDLS